MSRSNYSQFLQVEKGVYCLVGDAVDVLARKYISHVPEPAWKAQEVRDNFHHHITVFTPEEMSLIPSRDLLLLGDVSESVVMFELGLAHLQKGCVQSWYAVIYCPFLQRIRKQFNLPEKQLHITLGFYEQDLYGEMQNDLFQNISVKADLSHLISALQFINSTSLPQYAADVVHSRDIDFVSSLTFRQEKYLLSSVIYQLMELEEWPADSSSLPSTPWIVLKETAKQLFQSYFHSFLKNSLSFKDSYQQLLEDLGWFLFPKGNFLGLKILLFLQLEKQKSIQLSVISSYLPLLVPKDNILNLSQFIENIIELNKLILSFGQTVKNSKSTVPRKGTRGVPLEEEHSFKKCIFILVKKEKNYYLELIPLPRNFSFVPLLPSTSSSSTVDSPPHPLSRWMKDYSQLFAGSAYPSSLESLLALFFCGIRHIFTIHEESFYDSLTAEINQWIANLYSPLFSTVSSTTGDKKAQTGNKKNKASSPTDSNKKQLTTVGTTPSMTFHHYQVNDRTPPSIQQLKEMMTVLHSLLCHEKQASLIHCQGGVGRTNTVILAYLMLFQNCSFAEGYEQILSNRKVILSLSQQETLKKWYQLCYDDEILLSLRQEIFVPPRSSEEEEEIETSKLAPVFPLLKEPVPVVAAAVNYESIADALKMPPVIMFVGLPSSGKSTFSKAMIKAFPNYFIRINRDEMRGKGECESLLQSSLEVYLKQERQFHGGNHKKNSAHPVPKQVILIDNCHITKSKRMDWIQACHSVPVWCVHLNRPVEVCKERILTRENHPTIQNGAAGVRIIESMRKEFEVPTLKEGFETIFDIKSDEDMANLMEMWKIPFDRPNDASATTTMNYCDEEEEELEGQGKGTPELTLFSAEKSSSNNSSSSTLQKPNLLTKPIKFPKIPHLVNLGAATRDDKILSAQDIKTWIGNGNGKESTDSLYSFIIEEKIDGANIGIWISAEEEFDPRTRTKTYKNYQIMIQNRSHYINQYYHKQFEKIHLWIEKHKYELYRLLTPNETILYGEWVYAKHSISYNQLPDYFVAYDLFSVSSGDFLKKKDFLREMSSHASTITVVPVLFEGKIRSLQEILNLVNGPSQFSTTDNREGIVIRVHKKEGTLSKGEETLLMKCKIVREHFIAGNDRWNKSEHLLTNTLAKKF
jgi:tRNA uridine 5-carbamoylmethylation protein Kti12